MSLYAIQYEAQEWGYTSGKAYADPFNDLELDVLLTHESGHTYRVPTYWAGEQEWRVRFAPPLPGSYQVTTECTDKDSDLHGKTTSLLVSPYSGKDPLLSHGALKVAASRRTLEYSDGTPFFWLGDTWWMGLCKRLPWPDGFQQLAADRAAKGFTVIQIVAGLYPDMPGFDPRGENEAGFPWEPGYARINPSYFDMADLRIRWMVRSGLTPCIVSGWGYYLPILGIEKIKKHWRNLVARYGAYPVIWCLAGEVLMPYYLSEDKDGDVKIQREGWIEAARYLRQIDPYHHLVTVHDQMLDSQLIDINMMQTGHDGYFSVPNTVKMVKEARLREPVMPELVGEANYEGIMHTSEAEAQRLTFWSSVLSGAMGHTYGANGIWQVNNPDRPYGASPWGGTWGGLPWNEAMRLPGGTQIALGKKLLERYDWQRFEPHQDWVDPCGSPENVDLPFAAGIPGEVRVIYFYKPTVQLPNPQNHITHLEPGVIYRAFFWDPRNGQEYDLGEVSGDADGAWAIPIQPELKDWVVVLERKGH